MQFFDQEAFDRKQFAYNPEFKHPKLFDVNESIGDVAIDRYASKFGVKREEYDEKEHEKVEWNVLQDARRVLRCILEDNLLFLISEQVDTFRQVISRLGQTHESFMYEMKRKYGLGEE